MISSGGCPTTMTRNGEHNSIRPKPSAASSIRSITATLFNGKQLEIQYTFDPLRSKEDRVLIARHCLSPVIGGSLLRDKNEFTSIPEIVKFVNMHVHLNMCSDCQFASCPCHIRGHFRMCPEKFEKPQVDECEYEHFHHYCSVHVASWFENYLLLLILFQESRQLFDQEIANVFLLENESRLYFNRGKRPISEFLLKYAMEI
ncbi:repeat element 25 protein [Diadegma fenestrale ichnovirus]|nr:repeat element 25 protein [Diadegma fenestrale ichnovirus]ULM71705.1 repeat element 25 protein [Diadegma fenestrale ichnovirus]